MYVIYLYGIDDEILRQGYARDLKELCSYFMFLGSLPGHYEGVQDGIYRVVVKYGEDCYHETDLWHFR